MKRVTLLLPLLILACGDDAPVEGDACTVDSADAGTLFVLATTPAFDASSLEAVGPGCTRSTSGLVTVSGDAVLRVRADTPIQILNRGPTSSLVTLNDGLTVSSEVPLSGCNALETVPLANGDNFITCGFEAQARLVSGTRASAATDLSVFAGSDGVPDMAGAARIGDRIYVAIQRLEGFVPAGNGQLVVIDASTLDVVDANVSTPEIDAIDLPCENPTSRLIARGSSLYVACSGDFSGEGAGGVAVFDTTRNSAELVVSDVDLGGYPSPGGLAVSESDLFAVVAVPGSEPFTTEEMRAVRVRDGAVSTLYSSPDFTLAGIAVADGALYVGDRSADETSGVYRIDLSTDALDGPIGTTVPPFSLGVR